MRPRDVPSKYQGLYDKAMSGKSRRAAIRIFCLECTGYNFKEVAKCPAIHCPLHPYRLGGREFGSDVPPEGVHLDSRIDVTAQIGLG